MTNQLVTHLMESCSLPNERAINVARFQALLEEGNQRQNLTRLFSADDFIRGHLIDCMELVNSGFLEGKALDLGSGGGVPGLLSALLEDRFWILAESERSKADFLQDSTRELHIDDRVEVHGDRAENVLLGNCVDTVVSRAVGSVAKIHGWIKKCSTWNKLVLFKGPGWPKEWEKFAQNQKKRLPSLRVEDEHHYEVAGIQRRIVKLTRVLKD